MVFIGEEFLANVGALGPFPECFLPLIVGIEFFKGKPIAVNGEAFGEEITAAEPRELGIWSWDPLPGRPWPGQKRPNERRPSGRVWRSRHRSGLCGRGHSRRRGSRLTGGRAAAVATRGSRLASIR